LLGGGLTRGTSTLVLGPAGSGKSTLATQFLIEAARCGDRSAAFMFDESYHTFRCDPRVSVSTSTPRLRVTCSN
jgi:circadian clock protein KaiC